MSNAIIFGAGGGLGQALAKELQRRNSHAHIYTASRTPTNIPGTIALRVDPLDEASLAAAADEVATVGPLSLCLSAVGILSDGAALQPEKSYRQQTRTAFETVFAVNTIAPALIAKHMLPLLPRQGRAVFAALSARVGSIGDNQTGGWHAYRASKAALNMLIRNYALEMARRNPDAICLGLHPGTVATALSAPFAANVRHTVFTPAEAAAKLLDVIAARTPADSGAVFDHAGQRVPE